MAGINPAAVSTLAGSGTNATTDGTGTAASFRDMSGVVVSGGFAYVGTVGSVRKVNLSSGAVTTLAGNATAPGCDDNSDPSAVRFNAIDDVATDGSYLYVLSEGCASFPNPPLIRKVALSTGATTTLTSVLHGVASSPASITVGADGKLYVTNGSPDEVVQVDLSSGSSSVFATLSATTGAITGDVSSLWVASGTTIKQVALSSGAVSSFASASVQSLEAAGAYVYAGSSGVLNRFAKSDASWTTIAGSAFDAGYADGTGSDAWFGSITGIAADGTDLWLADSGNHRLRRGSSASALPRSLTPHAGDNVAINPAAVSTVAGDGTNANVDGTGTGASFAAPDKVVVVGGYAYVAAGGAIRKVNLATGAVSTLAGSLSTSGCVNSTDPSQVRFESLPLLGSNLGTDGYFLYSISDTGECAGAPYAAVRRTSLTTGATSTVGQVFLGKNIVVGPNGDLYVTSYSSSVIQRMDTASGALSSFFDFGSTANGDIFGLVADQQYLYAQVNATNQQIQRVSFATQTNSLVTMDSASGFASAGNYLYAAKNNVVVRYRKSNGSTVTVAGAVSGYQDGTGASAKFASGIGGMASDGTNLYAADTGNNRLRLLVPGKYPTDSGGPSALERMNANKAQCNCSFKSKGKPVELSTGNYYESFTDLAIPGRGPALDLTRTYNSLLASQDGPFGYGWTSPYQMALHPGPYTNGQATMQVVQENGTLVAFSWNGSAWVAPSRVFATLIQNGDGTYTFTRRSRDQYVFDASGLLLRQVSLLGFAGSPSPTVAAAYTTMLAYTSGRLTTVTDPAGRTLTFSYGTNGKVSQVADSSGRQVSYGYNSDGELTDVTDVESGNTHFGYAPPSGQPVDHLLRTVRDPRGNTIETNVYDSDGRVTSQSQVVTQNDAATGSSYQTTRTLTFDYTSIASATKVTDPKGNITVDAYSDGVLTSETKGYGTSKASTWTYVHDSNTLGTTQTTDPYGGVTKDTWDSAGNRLTHQDPGGDCLATPNTGCWTWTYNSFGQVLTSRDPKLVTTTYTRDGTTGLLQSTSTPLDTDPGTNQVTSHAYGDSDHPGDVTSVTDPRGKAWTYTYDAAGDQTSATDPLSHTAKACFDSIGRRTKTITPKGVAGGVTCSSSSPAAYTTYDTYDDFGDLLVVTDPLGHQTTRHYDADRNVDSFTDGDSKTTSYAYDEANEPISITRADSPATVLRNEYFDDGSLKAQADGAGQVTSYTYDPLERLSSMTDPVHPAVTVDHDQVVSGSLQNKTIITDPAGTQTLAYDSYRRLDTVTYSDGTTPNVDYGYDADSQRTSMADGTGTSSWSWDSLHRMTWHTNGAGKTVSYTYWLDDQVKTIAYATGKAVTRTPDDAGRTHTIADWLSHTTTLDYDADNFLTTQTYPNSAVASYSPDGADRLVGITQTPVSGTSASWSYTRDAANLLTNVTSTGVGTTESYTPNALNQLASVNSATLSYDAADNLTRATDGTRQKFDVANELCYRSPTTNSPACTAPPSDATTFSYDSRGNRTGKAPSTAVSSSYGYDQADRLISAKVPTELGANGQYTPTTLTRILDTRSATRTGTCYQPNNTSATCATVTSSSALTFQVAGFDPDGAGGNPAPVPSSGVSAVVLNVTAYSPQATSSLVLYPSDAAKPGTRDLSFTNGQTASNAVIAKLGADGRVTVAVNGTTDVAADVEGYYASSGGSSPGGTYTPQVSARVADSRSGGSNTGTCYPSSCATLAANGITTVEVAGHGNVPTSGVSAVVLTVSALSTSTAGFGVVYPADAGTPSFRQLAFGSSDNVSTTVVTKLSSDGKIKIKAITGGFDFLVDVSGWYSTGPDQDDSVFISQVSQRILDTRAGADIATCSPSACAQLSAGSTTTVQVTGLPSPGTPVVPNGATAVVLNLTALNTNANGYLTLGTTTSNGLRVVTFQNGEIATNLVIAKLDTNGRLVIGAESSHADVLVDVSGWYEPASKTWAYQYDGEGLRASKTAPDGTITTYLWDDSGPLPLLIGETTGGNTTYYLYDTSGLPLEEVRPDNSTVRYYHHDQLGSTRLVTDGSGATTATFTYDAYGTSTSTSGSVSTPLGYAGQYTDSETGFQYLRARYYDPTTGQFMTRDPLAAMTRSAYGYVYGNPLNGVDPAGLWGWNPIDDAAQAWDDTDGKVVHAVSEGAKDFRAGWNSMSTGEKAADALLPVIAAVGVACALAEPCGMAGTSVLFGGETSDVGLVLMQDDAAATIDATCPTGQLIDDFESNPGSWNEVSNESEGATGRAYRGGMSVERVYEKNGATLARHTIYGPEGQVLHDHFRSVGK